MECDAPIDVRMNRGRIVSSRTLPRSHNFATVGIWPTHDMLGDAEFGEGLQEAQRFDDGSQVHDPILADRIVEFHRVLPDAVGHRVEMCEGPWYRLLGRPPHDELRDQPDTWVGVEFVLDFCQGIG